MLTRHLKLAFFLSAALLAQLSAQAGEVTLYSREGLEGRSLSVRDGVSNLTQLGFNDRAESMVIYSGRWEICQHADFRGDCRVFEPGEYHSLRRLDNQISSLREVGGRGGWRDQDRRDDRRDQRDERQVIEGAVVLYSMPGLRGASTPVRGEISNLTNQRFNDRTMSILIQRGTWEICEHADFRGQCHTLGPGEYGNLQGALNRSISSIRQVNVQGGGRDRDRDRDRDRRDGVELFDVEGFGGQRLQVRDEVRNLQHLNFNDRSGSVIVYSGEWQFCEHADFSGQCSTYGPGRYDRLGRLENHISSVRRVR